MENKNEIKIYELPIYAGKTLDNAKMTKSSNVDAIAKLLENKDAGFHERLYADDELKFCIDIDGIKKSEYQLLEDRIMDELSLIDGIDEVNWCYTVNDNGKENVKSNTKDYLYSHITISNFSANSSLQKLFWSNFNNKYPEYSHDVDHGHLGVGETGKWYRLPHQKKESKKGTEHIIKEGEMKDFILKSVEGCKNIDESIKKYLLKYSIEKPEKIKKVKKIKVKQEDGTIKEVVVKKEYKDWGKKEITEDDKKLVHLLKDKRFQDTAKWRKMCWIFKSVGLSYELFDELSKKHGGKAYNEFENRKVWNTQKIAILNMNIIHHFCKEDSPKEYAEYGFKYIVKDDFIQPVLKINQQWLLDEDVKKIKKVKTTDLENKIVLQNYILRWMNEDIFKSFSLKSPYGTGKTQMIKRILDTFEPKKILWLSYRKTLTNDLLGEAGFGEEYQFQDYQKGNFRADRLVIQLESILKLNGIMDWVDDDVIEYPSYDLIIIDEVESVLSQFNSPTFNGHSKEAFNFVENVLINSKKILALDGDIGNRTYNFLNNFGQTIDIVNDIKLNKRDFKITEDREKYINLILDDLSKDLKIAIVSMSSNECECFKNKIEEKYPNKTVLIYTGDSSDKTKNDLKKVSEIWGDCDVLLYSPTIESGVSYAEKDVEKQFDKIYGIICESTTVRQYHQMLARIRTVKNTTYYILNDGHFENHIVDLDTYFKFEEVKNSVMLLEGVNMKATDILKDGKMCKVNKLSLYDMNYIYNKTERLNSNKHYFLDNFERMSINKGHTFERLKDSPKPNPEEDPEEFDKFLDEDKINKRDILIATEDIDNTVYKQLLEKQKKDEATQEEKLKVSKHSYKLAFGIDKLNEEVLKNFDKDSIKKFVSLIDIENINIVDDNHSKEFKDKSVMINKLIKDMGFSSIFDKKIYKKDEFEKIMDKILKENILYTNQLNTQVRFNLSKIKKIENIKQFLGFTNSLLEQYSIRLTYDRKHNKEVNKKEAIYNLEILNNINELVEYKIKKGFVLKDSLKVRPEPTSNYYKDLFDFEAFEKREKAKRDFLEKQKLEDRNRMLYKFGIKENPLDFGVDV